MTSSTKPLNGGNLKITVQSSRERKKDSRQQAISRLLVNTLENSMLKDAACPAALAQCLSSLNEFLNSMNERGDERNLSDARSCDLALTRYITVLAKASAAKNQRFDETIILDGKVVLWLSTKFVEHTDLRRKNIFREGVSLTLIPSQSLWSFSQKNFLDVVKKRDHTTAMPRAFPQPVCLSTCRSLQKLVAAEIDRL
jgi:hypothetical protein